MRRDWTFHICPRPVRRCAWLNNAPCGCPDRAFRRRRRCRSRKRDPARAWREKGLIGFAQDRVEAHHLFAILIAQEGFVELGDFKPGSGRNLANMIGMMGVTAGIGEMEGEAIASLPPENEQPTPAEP